MIIYPDYELEMNDNWIDDLNYLNKFNISEIKYLRKDVKTIIQIKVLDFRFNYIMDSRLFDIFLNKKNPNNQCPICNRFTHIHEYQGTKFLNIVCCS